MALALAATATLAACGKVTGPGAGSPTPVAGEEVGYGWIGPSMEDDSRGGPIERAGLRLPAASKFGSMEYRPLGEREGAYVFTFEAPREVAENFCSQGGLGGPHPVTTLPPKAREGLGDVHLTAQSLACDGSLPSDPSWYRFALIDRGDPATIHLLLRNPSS